MMIDVIRIAIIYRFSYSLFSNPTTQERKNQLWIQLTRILWTRCKTNHCSQNDYDECPDQSVPQIGYSQQVESFFPRNNYNVFVFKTFFVLIVFKTNLISSSGLYVAS